MWHERARTITGARGSATFWHFKGDGEVVEIEITDEFGNHALLRVNRGQFDAAFQVVRHA